MIPPLLFHVEGAKNNPLWTMNIATALPLAKKQRQQDSAITGLEIQGNLWLGALHSVF